MNQPIPFYKKLAATPTALPKFTTTVTNSAGEKIILADPKATRALVALMNYRAVVGGAACHWGGPAALAELMSAVHTLFFHDKSRPWYENFHFINDVGHAENGLYALRANWGFDNLTFDELWKFRSLESKLTGHGESHLNPEQVLISNGPLGSAFPTSQGLCLADKLQGNQRITVCVLSDGASMEGEAREAFASIPGLAAKGQLNPYLLIVSDNNTKLSGRIDTDSFSMKPSFEAMQTLGWHVIKLEDGHDLQKVYTSLEQALKKAQDNPQQPVCLWAKTIKGYGVKTTAESASGGHGFPLKKDDGKLLDFVQEIYQGEAPTEFVNWTQELTEPKTTSSSPSPAIKKEKTQAGFARAMIQAAQEGYPLFSVSADLQGSTGVAPFRKEFPQYSLEVGVAESNMVSVAAGLSKAGYIPVVDTFAQFGVTKGNLPLTMANLSESPVIAVFSHTGFQDAADGASHQATAYLATVAAIPHTQVICCSCAQEAEFLMKEAIKRQAQAKKSGKNLESIVFFVGRENFPEHYGVTSFEWGKAQVLAGNYQQHQVTLVSTGPLIAKALKAAEILEGKGIKACVINNAFINHPDIETLGAAVQASKLLVTLEDHQIIGGMGAQLSHALLQAGHQFKLKSLGMQGDFGRSAYQADQLYQSQGMTPEAMAEAALSCL